MCSSLTRRVTNNPHQRFPLFSMVATDRFMTSLGLLHGPPNAKALLQDIRTVPASYLQKLLTLENNQPDMKP